MNTVSRVVIGCSAIASATGVSLAQSPQLGGEMKHIMVHLHGNMLEGHVDPLVPTPVMQSHSVDYTGNAAVLNGTMYNAQYGWMVEGFWAPPQGSFLWIEQIDATPGLKAYHGGTMMNQGTFAPIFGTDGSSSRIMWNGTMLHNWYAVNVPGEYQATYSIYFGDAQGVALPDFNNNYVTLNWTAVPAPGSAALLVVGSLLVNRRRRQN